VLFTEPLDDDHQVGYLPDLIERAVHEVVTHRNSQLKV
jgi:hypothetical protein